MLSLRRLALVTVREHAALKVPFVIHRPMASTSQPNAVSITDSPAVGQRVLHNGKEYTTLKEGLAYILIPSESSTVPQTAPNGENDAQSVFYNPIQQFNRDLSVLAIKAYGEEVLERKLNSPHKGSNKKGKKRKREEEGTLTDGPEKLPKLEQNASVATDSSSTNLNGTSEKAAPSISEAGEDVETGSGEHVGDGVIDNPLQALVDIKEVQSTSEPPDSIIQRQEPKP